MNWGQQVGPRLEHDLPFALGPDGALDRGQDLGPGEVEGVGVRPGDDVLV
ncbi:MAG TPA: hypothetical protein VG637_02145 [Actinomycetes bacterium]|nr:hypothetical protein [Actinomycetes bacterium]